MKTLLCCIVKLENKYIAEWILHYKKIGFTHIHIYDNNDSNGPYAERLEDVTEVRQGIEDGFITVTKIPGKCCAQVPSYNDCYANFSNDYDWIAFFDIDEYLILENTKTISQFLSQSIFDKYQMIHLNWKVYDDNDQLRVKDGDYSIVNRFTRPSRCIGVNAEIKSIVRTKIPNLRFSKNPHTLDTTLVKCCNALGKDTNSKTQRSSVVVHKNAWLNHYICKTIEEYCTNKLVRLGGHTPHSANLRYNMEFFFKYNMRSREKIQAYNECIKQRMHNSPIKTTEPITVKYTPAPQIASMPSPSRIIPKHSERILRNTSKRETDPKISTTGKMRTKIHL